MSATESNSEESERSPSIFFRLRLWLRRVRSSENQIVDVGS